MDSLHVSVKSVLFASVFSVSLIIFASPAQAQKTQYASENRRQASVGYYARARTFLVEALEEYEEGRRFARPDLLHDPEEFRLTLISLTEQLNRLVDPQVRITRDGVRFQANPRLIKRASKQLPVVADGAKESNDQGEKARMKKKQASRAKLYRTQPEAKAKKVEQKQTLSEPEKINKESEMQMQEQEMQEQEMQKYSEMSKEPVAEEEMMQQENMPEKDLAQGEQGDEKELFTESSEAKAPQLPDSSMDSAEVEASSDDEMSEDDRIASAIESAIQDRLKSLEVDLEEEGEQ